ncbi:MAG: T9SS type A sorting domain-containing protein [Chitinophagales bacterium]
MKMKNIQLLFLILLFASFQNEAYKGGEGDGFAQGELIRFTTSIEENISKESNLSIFPNPVIQGETVNIESQVSAEFSLINTNGNTFYLGTDIRQFSTAELAKGSYILQVKKGDTFDYRKLLVL